MITKLLNLLGKLLSAGMILLLFGMLYVGTYFWQKSGQPMSVAEAQKMAPGLTFRDFWTSRVTQWRYWDDEKEKAGLPRTCESNAYVMSTWRLFASGGLVAQMRDNRENLEYIQYRTEINNGVIPPDNLLYDTPFLDAWWFQAEEVFWWAYGKDPGFPGGPKLNHRRACSTTYPTPEDVSANRLPE